MRKRIAKLETIEGAQDLVEQIYDVCQSNYNKIVRKKDSDAEKAWLKARNALVDINLAGQYGEAE